MDRVNTNTAEEMMDQAVSNRVDLDLSSLSANICAELAAGLADAEGIKARYELTDNQWKRLKNSPVFRSMLKEALMRFHGDMNAGKRITVKSEIALEDSIPLLHKWAHDSEVAISNRLDAIKQMTVLAGRTARDGVPGSPGATGGGFNVNIVIKGHAREERIEQVAVVDGECEEAETTSIPRLEEAA